MSVFKMQDQEKLSVKGAIISCRPNEQSYRMFDYWIIGSKGAKSQVDSQTVYKELNLNVVIVVRDGRLCTSPHISAWFGQMVSYIKIKNVIFLFPGKVKAIPDPPQYSEINGKSCLPCSDSTYRASSRQEQSQQVNKLTNNASPVGNKP